MTIDFIQFNRIIHLNAHNCFQIPLDKSNATFDNTLDSTLDTTGFSANSTKIDDSQIEDGNDETEAEPEPEPEPEPSTEAEVVDSKQEPELDDKDEGVDTANDIDNDNDNDIGSDTADVS